MDIETLLVKAKQDPDSFNLRVPRAWNQSIKLFPYQKTGAFHLAVKKRFILGDPVGSGKTPQCLYAWALVREQRQEEGKDLRLWVVTTRSAVHQWANEIDRFIPGTDILEVKGSHSKPKRLELLQKFKETPGSVLISSWNVMQRDWLEFKQDSSWFEGTQVVLDEVQKMKSPKSQAYKAAKDIITSLDRVHGLTATLVKDRGHDAYTIVSAFYPNVGTLQEFEKQYCVYNYEISQWYIAHGRRQFAPQGTWVRKLAGYQNLTSFGEQIQTVYLGRTDEELGIKRPDVVQMDRFCEMSPAQRKEYSKAEVGIIESSDDSGAMLQPALAHAQQIANSPEVVGCSQNSKLDALKELLEEDLEGDPVILYSPFETTVSIYAEALKQWNPVKITGKEGDKARKDAQEKFQTGGTDLIFITDAGGEALNLQRAKHVVFISRPWSPGQYTQVVGRARRFGSEHQCVTIWHLSCLDTIDEFVDAVLGQKFGAVEDIVRGRGGLIPDDKVVPLEIARQIRLKRVKKTKKEVRRG